jgi:hypothetical protein
MNPLDWGPWLYGKFFAHHNPFWGYLFACGVALVIALVAWTQIKDKYEGEHPSVSPSNSVEKRATIQWYRTNAIHQPDPFPLNQPLEFQVSVLNIGNERARRVFGFPYLGIAEGNDRNYQTFVAAMFEPAWQQQLAIQKLTEPNGREIQPGKDELGFTVHGPVINEELKKAILSQTKFVFLVMAMRYEDSQGEHELQVSRYLKPPFEDMKTWSAGTIHEGTIDIKQ